MWNSSNFTVTTCMFLAVVPKLGGFKRDSFHLAPRGGIDDRYMCEKKSAKHMQHSNLQ